MINNIQSVLSTTLKNKQFKIDFILIVFLIASSFLFSSAYRELTEDIMWHRDDAYAIFVADSFRNTGDFFYIGESHQSRSVTDIIESNRPVTFPFGEKGTVYFIAMGSLFSILDSDASNWYQHGSMLNSILAIVFLILLYSLLRIHFGIHVAFFSSLLIAFLPIFVINAATPRPIMLFFVFTIISFFFLKHRRSNYILFGIFAGLAHLTHPFGIILPITYFFILLLNQKFRGFLITFVVYQLILIPWYVRSLYYFNDFGKGLLLPFSKNISNLFPVFDISNNTPPFMIFKSSIQQNFSYFDLASIMNEWYGRLDYYGLGFHIFFLTVFVGFAFFKIPFLKQNLKILLPCLIGILLLIFVIYTLEDEFLSLLLLFIPITLGITIFLKHKIKLEINNQRLISLILIYFTFSFMAFYVWQLRVLDTTRAFDFLDVRVLFPALIFLIPLGVIGLYKINEYIFNFKSYNIKKSIVIFFIMGIIVSTIIMTNLDIKNSQPIFRNNSVYESDVLKNTHLNLRNNYTENTLVMSNNPLFTFLRTGMTAIPTVEKISSVEKLISHYDISLIINYKTSVASLDKNPSPDLSIHLIDPNYYQNFNSWPIEYNYKIFETNHDVQIFQVSRVIDYDIADGNLVSILAKGVYLKQNGDIEGKQILQTLVKNESLSISEKFLLCNGLIFYKEHQNAIPLCIESHLANPSDESITVLEKLLPYSDSPNKILIHFSNYLINQHVPYDSIETEMTQLYKLHRVYDHAFNYISKSDPTTIDDFISMKFKLVDFEIEETNYDKAKVLLLQILIIDRQNIHALEKQIIIYEKTENFSKLKDLKELLEVIDVK